jgi:hypothetical protein
LWTSKPFVASNDKMINKRRGRGRLKILSQHCLRWSEEHDEVTHSEWKVPRHLIRIDTFWMRAWSLTAMPANSIRVGNVACGETEQSKGINVL